jgi:polyisoprenoid-binding protein YceI
LKVAGELTIRGITKAVELAGTIGRSDHRRLR